MLKQLIYGAFIGMSLLAPGLSAATTAIVLGIYEELIASINQFFSKKWKKSLAFLLPLGIGAVGAILLFARVIEWALAYHEYQIFFLFLGFVIGAIPLLVKASEAKKTFRGSHFLLIIIVGGLVAMLNLLHVAEGEVVLNGMSGLILIRLFFTGVVISIAMILPGLSGSLMLILMGMYGMLVTAVSDMNLTVIGVFGLGAIVSLVLSSRGIQFLLKNYMSHTYAASIGMVLGSTVVIFPGIASTLWEIISSLLLFGVGIVAVWLLDRKKNVTDVELEIVEGVAS